MTLRLVIIGIILTLSMVRCQVKVITDYKDVQRTPLAPYEPFGIIESDTIGLPNDVQLLGSIVVKGGPFTIYCDDYTVRKALYEEARCAGANLVDI